MKKYIVKENGEIVGVFLNAGQACALNDEYLKFGRSCTIDIVTEPDETEPAEADETETEPETAETKEEESRMENVLYYEERGCFHDEMRYEGVSDMQNFRIFCEFEGKDGKHIYAEFSGYDREPMKINGKKDPGFKNRLHASLSYEDERGCWGFTPAAPYMGIDTTKYNYTREDILRFINAVSAEHFTAIQPRLILDCKNHYSNFTGSGLMVHIMKEWKKQWSKREDFAREYEVLHYYDSTFLRIRGQIYEYAGIEEEKQNPENAPGYNDYKVRFDRITDTERAEKIKAEGIETLDTLTA